MMLIHDLLLLVFLKHHSSSKNHAGPKCFQVLNRLENQQYPRHTRTRSCYVESVPTILELRQSGSNYVVTRSLTRPLTATLLLCIYSFEHVQSLTTSLPFLHSLLRPYHAFNTLIPFLPRSSGSHYALTFLESVVKRR